MSVRNLQPTPTIVIEDVDQSEIRSDHQFRFPPCDGERRNSITNSPGSVPSAMIQPDVDAYVTPLSLCQTPTPPATPSPPLSMPVMDLDKLKVV